MYEELIEERKQEMEKLRWLWNHVQELNINHGLSQKTLDEISAKVSSRLAFCERSIKDHTSQ